MATGYGYVRDKEPLSINWAEISKGFNDRLNEAEAERQSKREDIQKQYDELSQELINKPTGADTDLNNAISSFSTQASQASLENLNKLKRGEITEQEYYSRRANLKSSTSNLFLYANNFNNQLQENLALIQSQDPNNRGSDGMAFQMALAQDMLNFKNTVAVIDPATDEVILVKTDENGEPTNEIVNVAQLGYLSTQKEYDYNYKEQIRKAIEGRGVAKYEKDGKTITTIQGAEINPDTATATVDALAESLLGDEAQQRSILAQNGYKYTQDESLKGKEGYIYYDINNNTYDVDTDAALEFVKQDINNSIPVEIKSTISEYQQAQLDRADRAFFENVRQFDETIKLKEMEAGSTALTITSPQSLFLTTTGETVSPNNYIRTISTDNFETDQGRRDVQINLNEILKAAQVPEVSITYDDTIKEITPAKSRTMISSGATVTTPAVKSFPTMIINTPLSEQPIVVPINNKTNEYIERIMSTLELAKNTGEKINPSEFTFIVDNDFYNGKPLVREEDVEVDTNEGGVDPTKYNN